MQHTDANRLEAPDGAEAAVENHGVEKMDRSSGEFSGHRDDFARQEVHPVHGAHEVSVQPRPVQVHLSVIRPGQLPQQLSELFRRWVHHIKAQIGPRRQEISIYLKPESLGRIRLTLQLKEDVLHGKLEVSRPETARLLVAHQSDLTQRMADLDVRVGQLDVSVNSDLPSGAQFAGSHQGNAHQGAYQGRNAADGRAAGSMPAGEPEVTNHKWLGYNTIDYLA